MARLLGERLYFSILLAEEARSRTTALIDRLRAEHGWEGRPVEPDRRHITLAVLGDHDELPRELVQAAVRAAERVRFAPFEVVFNRVAGSKSLVLLGQNGLDRLRLFQAMLKSEMRNGALKPFARQPFKPHVTLLYDHCRLVERPVEPVAWTVRDFALIHSRLGRHEHRLLAHWSLSA